MPSRADSLLNCVTAYDIGPPPGAKSVEFTAPLTSTPTYSSAVPVPTSSDDPGSEVTGPPGDRVRCGTINAWSVLFGGALDGCLPLDVGIIGGITPFPLQPTPWTGSWSNPYPIKTGGPPEDGERPTSTISSSSSSSSSSTISGACRAAQTTAYTLPEDEENQDWEDLGTDPDFRRRRRSTRPAIIRAAETDPRRMFFRGCLLLSLISYFQASASKDAVFLQRPLPLWIWLMPVLPSTIIISMTQTVWILLFFAMLSR